MLQIVILLLVWFPFQTAAGGLAGTVTDPAGAAVSGALVEIIDQDTNGVRQAVSDSEGRFRFTRLAPGRYEVRAVYPGFDAAAKSVSVSVNVTGSIELVLPIESPGERVDVVAEIPVIDSTDYSIKTQVTAEAVRDLPLNGRKFLDLAVVAPGVTTVPADTYDPVKGGYLTISIAGQSGRTTRVTVDGVEINDENAGSTVQNFSPEIIQEFQVNASSFDLSTASSSSGSVNIVTRSGGNQIHGSIYGYLRHDRLSAYPGLKRPGAGRIPFSRAQTGFWAGGPLEKDRVFWFANFENNDQRQQTFIATGLPHGNPFDGASRQPFKERMSTLRLDVRPAANHSLFGRWSWNDNSQIAGFPPGSGVGNIPDSCTMCTKNETLRTNLANQVAGGWTAVATPRLVHDVRWNLSTFGNRISTLGSGPEIRIMDTNFKLGTNRVAPQSAFQNRLQLREDVSWHSERHHARFGFAWHRLQFFGSLQYWNPGDILLHSPRDTARTFPQSDDDLLAWPVRYIRIGAGDPRLPANTPGNRTTTDRYFGYFEDTVNLSRRLNVTFGVNYRFDTNLVNYDMPKPAILSKVFDGDLRPTGRDKNNAGGRVGIAWDVSGTADTVVRGGWGIYHDTALDTLRHFERSHLGPAGSGYLLFNVFQIRYPTFPGDGDNFFNVGDNYLLRDALRDLNGLRSMLTPAEDRARTNIDVNRTAAIVDREIEMPTANHFNLGLQRKLPLDIVMTADATFRHTVHEYVILDGNHFAASIGPLDPALGPITLFKTIGSSKYKSVNILLERRFRNGFGWSAGYVASRFRATNADGLGIGELAYNNLNIRDSYGPNAQDRTHRMTATGIWSWKQWVFSSITSLASGPPLSAFVNGVSLTGSDPSQPNLLEGLGYNALNRTIHSAAELNGLISRWNQTRAGTRDAFGRLIPQLAALPESGIRFGDSQMSTDIRVMHSFALEKLKIEAVGEIFNLFNIANHTGYTTNPALPTVSQCGGESCSAERIRALGFLQPTGRATSIFGYGGARAVQFALRFGF